MNGDDPEAVVFCAELAFDYRQQFGRDVVIELVWFRRHGHNEAGEPAAARPMMYQNIRARKTTRELYIVESRRHGIRTNRKQVIVRKDEIVSISPLDAVEL